MPDLRRIALDDTHAVLVGELPASLVPDRPAFDALWSIHPAAFHEIKMHGRPVKTPRWQQAYGADYRYTGNTNRALPLTPAMHPWLRWAREHFDPTLNGLLLNWYDGTADHYIGKHRDSEINRVEGSPIVTLSFGDVRMFRMRPWRAQGFVDVPATDGSVIVIPWDTNRAFTHEVPASKKTQGRRISVTIRAFHE
ncbi:alpha-ketoglutarate-dependent dioxygenase AlkB [Paraliomyxa miuraensis]|uniref:alpha-ketoglutarate-dependent dioxygenase AlkB n=1 Tax=Paraliomyxa miuraensis TaxID=376150 RepID=UPI002251C079|nr:alpha-ketoglutarate-dependent dioxygenase AlkB [Paraliomyxa miuraensis]MCX4244237.1 alpha-ketoglutarate-dependent dioxygenase AlkB [Paraliomyxa miuraensis]